MNVVLKKTKSKNDKKYRYEVLYCPGQKMSEEKISRLHKNIYSVAEKCFDEVPAYQVLVNSRFEYRDKVIALAWNGDVLAGFSSAVVFNIEGIGPVLHLGLTCVHPDHRSKGLTHQLMGKAVKKFMLMTNPFGKVWISNCAAVLSSLVNVSLYFDKVYPSPLNPGVPDDSYRKIARVIDESYRKKIYINDDVEFDREKFVFRGSVKGTVFKKEESDYRYYHRNGYYNEFYKEYLDFGRGDEALQIGQASAIGALRHLPRALGLVK